MSSLNFSSLAMHRRQPKFVPSTALACIKLLEYYQIDLEGKHVVIYSRSNCVGRPLFNQLINEKCGVTVIHI